MWWSSWRLQKLTVSLPIPCSFGDRWPGQAVWKRRQNPFFPHVVHSFRCWKQIVPSRSSPADKSRSAQANAGTLITRTLSRTERCNKESPSSGWRVQSDSNNDRGAHLFLHLEPVDPLFVNYSLIIPWMGRSIANSADIIRFNFATFQGKMAENNGVVLLAFGPVGGESLQIISYLVAFQGC